MIVSVGFAESVVNAFLKVLQDLLRVFRNGVKIEVEVEVVLHTQDCDLDFDFLKESMYNALSLFISAALVQLADISYGMAAGHQNRILTLS